LGLARSHAASVVGLGQSCPDLVIDIFHSGEPHDVHDPVTRDLDVPGDPRMIKPSR
jgi:hypothetical protein